MIVNVLWRPKKRNDGLRAVARADAVISSAPSLLVESQVPAAAVVQLLSSLTAPHTPADNALILSSRHPGAISVGLRGIRVSG